VAKTALLVPNLLTWDGSRPVIGGLERYTWELLDVARQVGLDIEVHQNGNNDWEREVNGFRIIGHGLAQLALAAVPEEVSQRGYRILYGSILQVPCVYQQGSVVVSHGVWWDGVSTTPEYRAQMFQVCRQALQKAALVVSCDYSFLNVIRALLPDVADKIEVIPNFVDPKVFYPRERKALEITLLYPRRLDDCRGIDLFLQAGVQLIKDFPQVKLYLAVDWNHPQYNQKVDAVVNSLTDPERVKIGTYSFAEMPEVYRQADIVVIPSRYSEGFSFSCLEAMASGCAVVATQVGGMTNLVLDGYNGLLVPPRAESILHACRRLIQDQSLRMELGEKARSTALAFSRQRWRAAWAEVLKQYYV